METESGESSLALILIKLLTKTCLLVSSECLFLQKRAFRLERPGIFALGRANRCKQKLFLLKNVSPTRRYFVTSDLVQKRIAFYTFLVGT